MSNGKEKVNCENCNFTSERRFFKSFRGFDLLCPVCYNKMTAERAYVKEIESGVEADIAKLRQINDEGTGFSSREEYFSAEHTEIDAIIASHSPQEAIIILRNRSEQWQQVLFEHQNKQYVVHQRLQELTFKLRAEERERLGLTDVEYATGGINKSNVAPKAPKKDRVSASEKAYISMAKTLFSKQLALFDLGQKSAFTQHPEWFSNGEVITKHKADFDDFIVKFGALSLEMAVERAKHATRAIKAKQIEGLANGSIRLSALPSVEQDDKKEQE